jgi:FkbM family methyltransferase
VLKPEHVFQPRRFLTRLVRPPEKHSPTAMSSFGLELSVMPDEMMSNSIRRKGMFDIVTAELLYRLLDEGEHALDVGAHVGLMSVIMALRVGPSGRVSSLEPHPDVFSRLRENAERVNVALCADVIRPLQVAASSAPGEQRLMIPAEWRGNTGAARLQPDGAAAGASSVSVQCVALDDLLGDSFRPTVMKLDVEGYELAVLAGADRTVQDSLRDIVFEDFGTYPTPVMALLQEQGFSVFALSRSLTRLRLSSPDRAGIPRKADPNYLATRDPARAMRRAKGGPWRVLDPLLLKRASVDAKR